MDGIRRSAGIDWAKERHAVCIIDERGQVLSRFEVEHSAAGLRELVSRLAGVEGVAIERPDGPVVEALLEAGLPVVVIASRHVKALRTRHGLAATRTTAPTRTSSPTPCAPTASASGRCVPMPPGRWPCGRPCGRARTSSATGPRWRSSWRRASRSPSPERSSSSTTWPRRSPGPS
jgi:hypothetical protein